MSYILDALKRSQQERELGRVPTLASSLPTNTGRPNTTQPWIIAALALALIAVALALYAALAARTGQVEPPPPVAERSAAPAPPAIPRPADKSPAMAAEPEQPVALASEEPEEPIELDLSEVEVADPVEEKPAMAAPPPAGPIPADLLGEVEAFKRKLEQTPGAPPRFPGEVVEANRPRAAPAATSPPPVPPEPDAASGEPAPGDLPGENGLPASVQSRLPARRLTVHVYAPDPAARFAIINSEKLREGDRTGDGLVLEEVRPDGVILSFQGHRFFEAR